MKKQLGEHYIVEFYEINKDLLNDEAFVSTVLVDAAKVSKSKVLDISMHKFHPQGLSGVVVIEESHISIHTWPELGYAAIDIYTCGDHTLPDKALNYLRSQLKPNSEYITKLARGIV